MRNRVTMIFSIIALVLSVWIPKGVQAANPPEVSVSSISELFGKRGQLVLWRGVGASFPGSQAAEASIYLLPDNDASPIKGYAADIGNKKAVKFGLPNSEFPTFVSLGALSCTSSGKYQEATSTTWFLSGNKLGSVGETWVVDFDWRTVPATSGGGFFNLDCTTGNPDSSINPNPPAPDPTVCAPVNGATYLQDKAQLPQAAQLILVWGGNDKRFMPPTKWQGIAATFYKGLGDNCLMDGVVQMANDIGQGRATAYGGNAPPTIIWAPLGWNEKRVQQCTLPYSQDGLVIISDTLYGDSKCFTIIEYHDTQFVVPPPPPPPSVFRLFVPMVTNGGPQSLCPDQSGWIPQIGFTKFGTSDQPSAWYPITSGYPTQPPGVNFWLRLRSADQTQWITQIGFTPMNGGNTVYDAEIYRGYAIPGDMTFIAKSNVQAGSVSIRITIRNILYGDCSRFYIVKVDDGAPPLQ